MNQQSQSPLDEGVHYLKDNALLGVNSCTRCINPQMCISLQLIHGRASINRYIISLPEAKASKH